MRGWWLLVFAAFLAGCVGVPADGPVQPGLPGPVPEAPDPLVRPIANPPEPGMSPTEVVAGFLDAAAAVGDDYRVARDYLTPEAASTWDPGAGVIVAAGEGPTLRQEGSTVSARFVQEAELSSAGVLDEMAAGPATAAFPMARAGEEWRIAEPPAGLLLTQRQLDRAFELRNVYYLDASRSTAVPDVRLLPRTGAQALATSLTTALLAGPSDWLAPGVASAIPDGMRLALGAVPVVDGVAEVDLQGPAVAGDTDGLEQLGAQLAWTLQQVPDLTAMTITLDERPLLSSRGPVPLSAYDDFDPDVLPGTPRLYGLTPEGDFAAFVEDAVQPAVQTADGSPADQPAAASVAASPRSALVAGAAADGAGLLVIPPGRAGAELRPASLGYGPRIDGQDRLWWVRPDGRVRIGTADPEQAPLAVRLPAGLPKVSAVVPSRDGTRVALLAGSPQPRLFVGVLVAQDDGFSVRGPRELTVPGSVVDVTWRSADRLSVLCAQPDLLHRVDLTGSVQASFAVPQGVRSVADAPGAVVAVGLADDTVGRLTGDGVRTVPGITAPAYPG